MQTPNDWKEYELLDCGNARKLERWGDFVLDRPDPEAIWLPHLAPSDWQKADGYYERKSGGGSWKWKGVIPEKWSIHWRDLTFTVKPSGFKHTGLFPEQAVHWDWMRDKIRTRGTGVQVLNLFGYTGAASVACAKEGAEVTHIDASNGILDWAKENLIASGLGEAKVRLIAEDVFKYVEREQKRGKRYDVIILDPPAFGRGTKGETWKITEMLVPLLASAQNVLSDSPLFVLVNSYVAGLSSTTLSNSLSTVLGSGKTDNGEIGLTSKANGLRLPCGSFARWEP